jgi:hypothetical protein
MKPSGATIKKASKTKWLMIASLPLKNKLNPMKNSFKIGVLAAAIMFSISSCSSCVNKGKDGSVEKIDTSKSAIDTTQKAIDTTKKAGTETVKKDTVKK